MIIINSRRCLRCAGCISLCPELALYMDFSGLVIEHGKCNNCEICLKICAVEAFDIQKSESVGEVSR